MKKEGSGIEKSAWRISRAGNISNYSYDKKLFYSRMNDPAKNKSCCIIHIAAFKKILSILVCVLLISLATQAQEPTPQLLKEPATWPFERFALPPSFAPDFPYKGVEELRFSPGMFNKDSIGYFTYAFVTQLDDITAISQDGVKDYLLNYFKGLCAVTAKDRKLVVDTSVIIIEIENKKSMVNKETIYNAVLNIFGVFADGATVKLNTETKVLQDMKAKKVYLVFIASPQEKANEIWNELYKIQSDFAIKNL